MKTKRNTKRCLACGNSLGSSGRIVRGLHFNCYRSVLRRIWNGEITDTECVNDGLLLPPSNGGRPSLHKQEATQRKISKRLESIRKKKSESPRVGCATTIDQGGSVVDFSQEAK